MSWRVCVAGSWRRLFRCLPRPVYGTPCGVRCERRIRIRGRGGAGCRGAATGSRRSRTMSHRTSPAVIRSSRSDCRRRRPRGGRFGKLEPNSVLRTRQRGAFGRVVNGRLPAPRSGARVVVFGVLDTAPSWAPERCSTSASVFSEDSPERGVRRPRPCSTKVSPQGGRYVVWPRGDPTARRSAGAPFFESTRAIASGRGYAHDSHRG
jgi:hypothetical protein